MSETPAPAGAPAADLLRILELDPDVSHDDMEWFRLTLAPFAERGGPSPSGASATDPRGTPLLHA